MLADGMFCFSPLLAFSVFLLTCISLCKTASSQSNTTGEIQGSMPMKPVAPGTNLNMGMELWSSQTGVAVKVRPNHHSSYIQMQSSFSDLVINSCVYYSTG